MKRAVKLFDYSEGACAKTDSLDLAAGQEGVSGHHFFRQELSSESFLNFAGGSFVAFVFFRFRHVECVFSPLLFVGACIYRHLVYILRIQACQTLYFFFSTFSCVLFALSTRAC